MTNSYITTPIYYVNDAPHIGHAYTSVVCDVLARLKRLKGNDVKFLTGTDEHGQKVEKSAIKNGKTPQEFCDEVSVKFRNLADFLDISYDDFIRTTENRHKKTAQTFWKKLEENGWIYKDVYEGWYCVRDEAFYNEDELIDGKAPTGAEVEWQKEESYFFKLSEFQDILLEIYEKFNGFISPQSKKNEVVSFVRGGKEYEKGALKDLSISRTSFKWGIEVPGDKNHIMYVWLDALTNYLSALGYPDGERYKKFWLDNSCNDAGYYSTGKNEKKVDEKNRKIDAEHGGKIHIVGKDILRFHAVYWPAFLIAGKLTKDEVNSSDIGEFVDILPSKIFAHGWWTNEGEKISKSVGNIIDPYKEIEWLKSFNISEELAIEYFRYFLTREIAFGNDGDYSRERFINRINSELANNIGNLCQRSASMIWKNSEGKLVKKDDIDDEGKDLLGFAGESLRFDYEIEDCDFDEILLNVILIASRANEYFDKKAPWNLKKEGKIEEMNNVLYVIAEAVRKVAISLLAFTPKSANKILDLLNIDPEKRSFSYLDTPLEFGSKINEPTPIFLRLNTK